MQKEEAAMKLTGLHILYTYQCTFECEHCFVWGSPWQAGTFTLEELRIVFDQAAEVKTIEWIYFEGGEPFIYHPALVSAVKAAAAKGFKIGIVTNAYWAISVEDALEWLKPFSGLLSDLSISSDLYHYDEAVSRQARNAVQAAESLRLPVGTISIAQPEAREGNRTVGQLLPDESGVMYRGRAVEKLAGRAAMLPWTEFDACPFEDLREPGRVHLDPLGYLHICQGISVGNLFQQPLTAICSAYDPEAHPIVAPLLSGGPVELVRRYQLPHAEVYADACHLCYTARLALRSRFPGVLNPDQMYGVFNRR
jgi:organic radical activating enzyme